MDPLSNQGQPFLNWEALIRNIPALPFVEDEISMTEEHELAQSIPPMYQVILLSDPHTPSAFIMDMLEDCFRITPLEARSIIVQVEKEGQAVCGIYTREVAETKIEAIQRLSYQHHYPLKCIMRKEPNYVIKKS